MYSLRSLDVMSCAKMMGAIYGCLGLIFRLELKADTSGSSLV